MSKREDERERRRYVRDVVGHALKINHIDDEIRNCYRYVYHAYDVTERKFVYFQGQSLLDFFTLDLRKIYEIVEETREVVRTDFKWKESQVQDLPPELLKGKGGKA